MDCYNTSVQYWFREIIFIHSNAIIVSHIVHCHIHQVEHSQNAAKSGIQVCGNTVDWFEVYQQLTVEQQ